MSRYQLDLEPVVEEKGPEKRKCGARGGREIHITGHRLAHLEPIAGAHEQTAHEPATHDPIMDDPAMGNEIHKKHQGMSGTVWWGD
jgi:hypothetical protein